MESIGNINKLSKNNKYNIEQWSNQLCQIAQSLILKYKFLEYTNFNMQEFKLLLYLVSKLNDEQEEFSFVNMSIKEMEFALNTRISGGANLNFIHKKIENIRSKGICLRNPEHRNDYFSCNIIRSFRYDSQSKLFTIKLDDDMKQFLLGIKDEARAMFREGYVSKFKSLSALKLFIYLHSILNMKDYILNAKKLTTIMEYNGEFKNFHARVLVPALNYINNNTDITTTFTPIKENKKTVGYLINARRKPAWLIKDCGLTAYIDVDFLPTKDIKEHIPSAPILKQIRFSELSSGYKNILWGLEKQYNK